MKAAEFCPAQTPLGIPTLTTFQVRDRIYVVDVDGGLFYIDTRSDDPDLWCWIVVTDL